MAARRSNSGRRQAYARRRDMDSQAYVHGSVAAKPEFDPGYHENSPERPKKASKRVRKNRKQALNISFCGGDHSIGRVCELCRITVAYYKSF